MELSFAAVILKHLVTRTKNNPNVEYNSSFVVFISKSYILPRPLVYHE